MQNYCNSFKNMNIASKIVVCHTILLYLPNTDD